MFLVGLTGGIASGKSTVTAMLKELGCPIIDADLVAREVVEPGQPALKKIISHFGAEVLHSNGTLNREKLGDIIFNDSAKRKLLNSITHPEIRKSMLRKIAWFALRGEQFVVLDVPLLFETSSFLPVLAYTIVVYCDQETQLVRLEKRNNYTKDEAMKRIKAQMSLGEKCTRATHVIDNSKELSSTKEQVERIYSLIKKSRLHLKYRAYFVIALSLSVVTLSCVLRYLCGW